MKNKPAQPSGKPITAREAAMDILTQIEQEQAYSNLLLNQTLQKLKLEKQDAGLVTELVYGTMQRLNTIDYYLERFVAKGVHKLQPWVRSLLRMSFYQLYYLDRIPVHAIVNEAVNLAKKRGHQGISGMVNGVLRNIHRNQETLTLPSNLPAAERISLQHSHPQWMVKRWIKQYGEDVTEQICASNNMAPHSSVRVNVLKANREQLLAELAAAEFEARPSLLAPSGVIIESGGNMAHTRWFESGDLSIQDESSMLVAEMVDPKPGMKVLDCCAAPGGKTTHLAEKMDDQGEIVANDVHPHKEQLIRQQADRLGLSSIRTVLHDAKDLSKQYSKGSFDRILLDAPCSGLGVIRRKPDAKWTKKPQDIAEVAVLQYDILCSVAELLSKDGVLVYSTCTMEEEENAGLVRRFLSNHPQFRLVITPPAFLSEAAQQAVFTSEGMLQVLPHHFHSDGFFIARLQRMN